MKTLKEFLEKQKAWSDVYMFAKNLTLEEFLRTCPRGDWILWLFTRSNPRNKKLRVLVAAHCANTVRHLMKDDRSLKAVDIAIKYGKGQATKGQLAAAAADANADDATDAACAACTADAATAATAAADAAAATAAAYANDAAAAYADDAYAYAYAAACAAYFDDADAAAYAAYAADAYAADAKKKNQGLTADICRKYLPIELWRIK